MDVIFTFFHTLGSRDSRGLTNIQTYGHYSCTAVYEPVCGDASSGNYEIVNAAGGEATIGYTV
jgi:hypothetical protein